MVSVLGADDVDMGEDGASTSVLTTVVSVGEPDISDVEKGGDVGGECGSSVAIIKTSPILYSSAYD